MRYVACIAALIAGLVATAHGIDAAPWAFVIAMWLALNEK